jgi:PAS domain S-box-containing protein
MDNLSLAITQIDTQHRIITTNGARSGRSARGAERLIGSHCYREFEKRDSPCPDCPAMRVIETGCPVTVESRRTRPDGRRFDARICSYPLFAADGAVAGVLEVLEDISDRKQAEQAVRVSEAKLLRISDAALDAVIMADATGRIAHWNPAAERMFGYRREEVLGRNVHDMLAPPRYRKEAARALMEFVQVGSGQAIGKLQELQGLRKNGSEFPVELSLSTLQLDGQHWAVAIIRDITERKLAERELQEHAIALESANEALRELCEAAESASRAKSQFLANMSHELRTPLHGILSFSAFGIKKGETADRTDLLRYFHRIEDSGQILLALVNDLLDLAKLEAGKMQFDFKPVHLNMLVAAVADEFSSMLDQRGISLQFAEPAEPEPVVADSDKIMQVLRNVLSNAVKFSPDSSTIDITMRRKSERVAVTVSDQGVGIPEDELEAVFDEFIQSSKTRTGAGGTGLGLSICRQIITAHKGRIWAEIRAGGGTHITFEIPCDPLAASSGRR